MTERDTQIINLYLNHPELTTAQIAKKFNVSTGTIARIARVNNLPRRNGHIKNEVPQEIKTEIIQKYLKGTSMLQIQKQYNIHYEKLKKILQEYDCFGSISTTKRLNPNIIENYFEQIDTNEKAYWLGWIISDGAITNNKEKSKFQLELTLKAQDQDILHLLEKDLGVENKIYSSAQIYKRFSLGCKKIILDLEQLGITQNKSLTVKIPNIKPQFYPSLMRGLFDGDGGFTVYDRSNGQHCQELSFCGNEFVVTWIQQTLFQALPTLTKNQITKESSIKRIRWGNKKDIVLIRDYLYKDHNNHFLKRKKNLIYANTEVTN